MSLRRYWFRFSDAALDSLSTFGYGITARDREDALQILRDHFNDSVDLQSVEEETEDLDLAKIEKNHVLPNMGSPSIRGVWFPLGITQAIPWWKLSEESSEINSEDLSRLQEVDKND